ncbi:hypothetical protein [Lonepinella sp. BR2919]|uniref:hypothetical protein n=1 Tax=unclassified Lonepinella TaxID=2642006 RepID=UPI003F6DD084
MNISKVTPICSICDKSPITRTYRNEHYCASCYAQWFKHKTCKHCHQLKRIHRHGEICLDCERLTDCVRCGKKAGTFEIGKITQYGAVCNSCSLYFREEKECFECGKLSRNVSRSPLAEHNELLCLSCYRKYSFATCKNCRRYRKIANKDLQLCIKCTENLTAICPKCKNEMPSGYGNVCANCARRTLLFNLIRLNVHLFRCNAIKRAYKQFIFWYMRKCGISVALHKGSDFVKFFMDCDEQWQSIPNYAELVVYFKPNGLRANLTVLRWLIDTQQVVVDEILKDELAEMERIQALFNKLKTSVPCIASYYKLLQRRFDDGTTTLKSVRLALQPAIDLVSSYGILTYPTQEQLNRYLVAKSGQTAAITGFVNHLKKEYHCELVIDKSYIKKAKLAQFKKHCNQRLAILYRQVELTAQDKVELLSVVLYSLHSVQIHKLCLTNVVQIDGVAYYQNGDKRYFVPNDIWLKIAH